MVQAASVEISPQHFHQKGCSRNLTAARRSQSRFSAGGVGPDGGIHGRQPSGPRSRKERPGLRRIRRKVLALVSENEAHAWKMPWVARLVEQRKRH